LTTTCPQPVPLPLGLAAGKLEFLAERRYSMPVRLNAEGRKANPIFEHIYTADPSAHVWDDGRLYVYPSQDIDPPKGCDLMDKYHVFSTDDLINWVDHGQILEAKDVPWGRPEGGFMWAPDCAYKNGVYYFYFPHPSESYWNDSWKIGFATSKKPASDFKCQGYIEGLGGFAMIDPAVFVDDDGQAYMVYGGGGKCHIGKLKENMMEIDGEMMDISDQFHDYHEGPWLFKRNNIYYLMHPDNNEGANRMRYAMAASPMGPYKDRGIILDTVSSDTSHGSVVEFKGEWYLFYHNAELSGGITNLRSVACDKVHFNEDGTIKLVVQTF
jgi:beta-xylosidase